MTFRIRDFLLFSLAATSAFAGGGPQNTLVVVNDNSLESLELGQYYRERRAIPAANVFHIRTSTNYSLDTAGFTNEIRKPILDYIASSGLSNQIDYVVFSRGIPCRIYSEPYTNRRHGGLTAAMFYGFKSSPAGCELAAGSESAYYVSERAFTHAGSPSSNRYYASAILTASNLIQSKRLVDRSVEADHSMPSGTVFLVHTYDPRNAQWPQFENADFMARFLNVPQIRQIPFAEQLIGETNIIGYMLGRRVVDYVADNYYLEGALGDHLTSYGGCLYDTQEAYGDSGQMSLLEWIRVGCVGSYGTVVEPCAYTNKFPEPRLHYWYARGFNMGESYWMAVQNPYQGVVVGDPLCEPYAVPPLVSVGGLVSNQSVSGVLSLVVTGVAVKARGTVDRLDVFLDGMLTATLTNVAPTRFNVVKATVKGSEQTYTVQSGDTLFTVAAGLAAAINQAPLGVTARASGDRVEVVQSALGTTGAWMNVSASSDTSIASRLTVFAWSVETNFMETPFRAHEEISLSGTPASGDVVRAVVTDLNSVTVTNEVVAGTNDTAWTLMNQLAAVVGSNILLQSSTGCELTWLYNGPTWGDPVKACFVARTNTWQGHNLYVTYSVITQLTSNLQGPGFSDNFNDNSDVLSARATLFLAEGFTNLVASYSLDTTTLADGPHELTAVGYEGSAVRTQGRMTLPFVVDNHAAACAITSPPSASTFLLGETITAQVFAVAGGTVTSVSFYAEGKLAAVTGSAPFVFSLETTNYGVGRLDLQAGAAATNGEAVLSSIVAVTILPDYDFDGLDDEWEVRNFGSITNYTGADDPDADQASNRNEYTADTQPTNDASYFAVSRVDGVEGVIRLEFTSSTARQYRIHYNDDALMNGLWLESSNWLWGGTGVTTQMDDGSLMPVPTNDQRFYRVRAHRP